MRLVIWLGLRDLARDWVYLVCNVAVIAGVIVPLLVLFGVKNGVHEMLVGRLLADPTTLQIDSAGNGAFSRVDLAEVAAWPEVAFATLKTRSTFDFVNVRPLEGRGRKDAVLAPSGDGDPVLPPGVTLAPGEVAVSQSLADQLELSPGEQVRLLSQAENRPRQLALTRTVAAIVPADRLGGRAVLADLATRDLLEAFYDGYAIPDEGITEGEPLSARVESFAGLRVFARDLNLLRPLQDRLESRFGIATHADTRSVEATLGLFRNLDLALVLIATVAAIGLAATLVFSFWGEVARKRRVLASLALIGLPPAHIAMIPVVQALATALLGLAASFALVAFSAVIAQRLFGAEGGTGAGIVAIAPHEVVLIVAGVTAFVVLAAAAAARRAARTDPAIVLREAT